MVKFTFDLFFLCSAFAELKLESRATVAEVESKTKKYEVKKTSFLPKFSAM